MENTLENKAKFFAHYWGQKVLRWSQWVDDAENSTINFQVPMSTNVGIDKGWFLELTPLSQITDEDALWLGRDANEFVSSYEDDLKYCKELVERMSNKPHLINQKQGDYLRSKGYALPWMGLSVEQQIEFGWVKLK